MADGKHLEKHHGRRTYDDLINIFAGQHGEGALMQVHDGKMGAPPLLNILIRVHAHQQEIALLLGSLQTAQNVKAKPKSSAHEHVKHQAYREAARLPWISLALPNWDGDVNSNAWA